MMPANKKAFDLMGDDIEESSTENESLRNKLGYLEEFRLKESKANLLNQFGDDKRANLILSRLQKQMKKQ